MSGEGLPEREGVRRGSRVPSDTRARLQSGLSYVEVLIATSLVALALVPMLEGLSVGTTGVAVRQQTLEARLRVASRMEEILAQPFADLDAEALSVADPTAPTAYSDAAGTTLRRLVFLSRYDGDDADGDGDPFTGVDADLVWVSVSIENSPHVLTTLTRR